MSHTPGTKPTCTQPDGCWYPDSPNTLGDCHRFELCLATLCRCGDTAGIHLRPPALDRHCLNLSCTCRAFVAAVSNPTSEKCLQCNHITRVHTQRSGCLHCSCGRYYDDFDGSDPVGTASPYASAEAHDPVNHPPHYNAHPSGTECIDIVEHMPYNVGNAVKYLWRADAKGNPIEDLRKAAWYVQREIDLRLRKLKGTNDQ